MSTVASFAGARTALVALAAALAGCAPPTDRMGRVKVAEAPLLAEGEGDGPPAAVLHEGDLVRVVRTVKPHLAWKGMLDGKPAAVEGELVEVRRTGEGGGFLFREQLGGEVPAITADYICHRIHGAADCASKLRRIALDDQGSTVGYLPCFADACPVALVRGRRLSQMTVDGLTDLRPATVAGQQILLATSLVNHHPQWTEGLTHVIRATDGLSRVYTIKVTEVDTRAARNHLIEGTVTVEPDQIAYRGRERWVSALHDGAVLSDHPIAQNYRLSPAK